MRSNIVPDPRLLDASLNAQSTCIAEFAAALESVLVVSLSVVVESSCCIAECCR